MGVGGMEELRINLYRLSTNFELKLMLSLAKTLAMRTTYILKMTKNKKCRKAD